jgi:hypothetical protein
LYPFIVVGGGTAPKNPVSAKGLIFEVYGSIEDFRYAPGKDANPIVQDPVPDRTPYDNKRFLQFKQIDAFGKRDFRFEDPNSQYGNIRPFVGNRGFRG